MPQLGKVFLVGAGPGDPGLITVRGRECLANADVVVYDTLVNPELLQHAPNAEYIFVGKRRDQHSLPQDEINRVLIEQAQKHACVVRLKGGDPFVFGRGGEEALALAEAGIAFEIIPGVTAGIAAPAYAGIPVTHRGLSSSVTFLTAHLDEQGVLPNPNTLMQQGTLVLYMGVKSLNQVQQALIQAGRNPETPTAVIEWGTYARQRCIIGNLQNISERCANENIQAPALIVVGDVCALRDELHWFEARPLHGLRVVVTHAVERQGKLESRLRELGAEIFSLPMLQLSPAPEATLSWHPSDFDWIILSSVNAAKMLFDILDRRGEDARALHGVKLCAVGASTCQALEARYVHVDAAPEKYGTESVLKALEEQGSLQNARVLLPRSDIVRRSLPEALRSSGAQVTETVAYTHQQPEVSHENADALKAFEPGLLVFTNAAAIDNFVQAFSGDLLHTPIASIGPVTSAAAKAAGLKVAIEPAAHTVDDLLEAVCTWWNRQNKKA